MGQVIKLGAQGKKELAIAFKVNCYLNIEKFFLLLVLLNKRCKVRTIMPVTVKNYAGNICKDNPRLFNILQVSFLKEKADFLKKDIPFPTKEKKIKF